MGERLTTQQLAAFAREMLQCLWEGFGVDAGELQDIAEKHGVILETTFNSEVHTDLHGVSPYPGSPWYVEHPDLKKLAADRAALQAIAGQGGEHGR